MSHNDLKLPVRSRIWFWLAFAGIATGLCAVAWSTAYWLDERDPALAVSRGAQPPPTRLDRSVDDAMLARALRATANIMDSSGSSGSFLPEARMLDIMVAPDSHASNHHGRTRRGHRSQRERRAPSLPAMAVADSSADRRANP